MLSIAEGSLLAWLFDLVYLDDAGTVEPDYLGCTHRSHASKATRLRRGPTLIT